jgi:tetratricopeptide (TPR) repeat protein
MTMSRLLPVLAACIAAWLAAGSMAARADDLQEAQNLFRQGQQAQALERVNAYLGAKPKDAQARFLKGLILTEQNKHPEAIKVFQSLSEDYPELPEPYNNLAVLYAAQGQYDKAKVSLEMAIRTHPSYATAHENLGDIYAKMASQAYDKALQLDKTNATAQTKLSMIQELFSRTGASGGKTSGKAPPAQVAAAAPAKPAEKPAAPGPAAPAPAPAKPAPEGTKPAAPHPAAATGDSAEVLQAVDTWAKAWSAQNVEAYLAHYARDFRVPGGEARDDWEKGRRERITRPKSIQVSIADARVRFDPATSRVSVTFRQSYRSDNLKSVTTKTLVLVKSEGKWLIQQERIGG